MKVAILHGAITEPNRPDEQDTFVQVKAISEALRELGHDVLTVPFTLNLQEAARALRAASPSAVFNLVEAVEGAGRLIHLAPALLDVLGLPYTGSGTEALVLTSNKLLTKRALRARAMTTPRWYSIEDLARDGRVIHAPYIIKPVWEHASVGLDEDSVVTAGRREALREACLARSTSLAGACYAEAFIDGREFNVPLLAGDGGPQVLPPSEILFVGYEERQKWKVVGYRAKWKEGSFEYDNTKRRFDFPADDQPLVDSMAELAKQCWHVFELRGYARVDFRVDKTGTAYVLEINANPCLSPDGGFAAAVKQASMGFNEAIDRILRDVNVAAPPQVAPPPPAPPAGDITFREEVAEADKANVRRIVESTGMFYPHEVEVAVELVEDRLHKGLASGYYFLFAEAAGEVVGYACYGPIACTANSYDLFWIAVRNDLRGKGLGRVLLDRSEAAIAQLGGKAIYIETSSRDVYRPTRAFYRRCGYREAATLKDFYGPGDDRVIFLKHLA